MTTEANRQAILGIAAQAGMRHMLQTEADIDVVVRFFQLAQEVIITARDIQAAAKLGDTLRELAKRTKRIEEQQESIISLLGQRDGLLADMRQIAEIGHKLDFDAVLFARDAVAKVDGGAE